MILAQAYKNGDLHSQECALSNCELEIRLAHGGIVDRNAALMDGDIVYVQFKNEEEPIPAVRKGRTKGKLNKRKEAINVETTKIGAYDSCYIPKDSTDISSS